MTGRWLVNIPHDEDTDNAGRLHVLDSRSAAVGKSLVVGSPTLALSLFPDTCIKEARMNNQSSLANPYLHRRNSVASVHEDTYFGRCAVRVYPKSTAILNSRLIMASSC
jgi:hypothetical protein